MIGKRIILIQRRSNLKPRKKEGSISLQLSPSGINAMSVISLYDVNIIRKMINRLKTHNKVLGRRKRKSMYGQID